LSSLDVTVFPSAFCFRIAILWRLLFFHCDHVAKHHPCAISFLTVIGSVPLYIYPILTLLLNQELWGKIGQEKMERDRMILQLEDYLNHYVRKPHLRSAGLKNGDA
jgi:hypothetical protein